MQNSEQQLTSKEWLVLGALVALAGMLSASLTYVFPQYQTIWSVGFVVGIIGFCVFGGISVLKAGEPV